MNSLAMLAQQIQTDLRVPDAIEAGKPITFHWRVGCRLPSECPAFIVVSISDDIRVDIPSLDAKLNSFSAKPDLPGFLVLPQLARAPLDLRYGAQTSRLLVPLHQLRSRFEGAAEIRVFTAGPVNVRVAVVAKARNEEHVLAEHFNETIIVDPGNPEVIVADAYDLNIPANVIVSNMDRYKMHVFDNYYQVFDVSTHAKIIERAGHRPTFSPTSRFVVAEIGNDDGHDFEVVDLVSREVIARPFGYYVGFAESDAYLIDGQYTHGFIVVRPTLLSRGMELEPGGFGARGDGLDFVRQGRCTACPAWDRNNVTLDLDAGIIIIGFEPGQFDLYELATGFVTSINATRHLNDFVRMHYKAPFQFRQGWIAAPPFQFTHTILRRPKDNWDFSTADWYPSVTFLERQRISDKAESPGRQLSPTRGNEVNETSLVRGDWRMTFAGARENAPTITAALADTPFLLTFAQPLEVKTVPFSNSGASEEGSRRWPLGDTEQDRREAAEVDAAIRTRSLRLTSQLLENTPILDRFLVADDSQHVEYEALDLDNHHMDNIHLFHKISIDRYLEGLWQWSFDGTTTYLLQLLGLVGSDSHGVGGLWLLRCKPGEPGEALFLEALMKDGFWLGEHGKTSHFNRLVVELFFHRYLIMASKAARTLAVFDIEQCKTLLLIKDLPQADLLEGVAVTADGRYIVQTNSDGQLFVFEFKTGRNVVLGRAVDGETVLYTPEGYYWSSYEGAHFVHVRFPGSSEMYSFQQFAAHLDRPEVVKGALAGRSAAPRRLVPPPSIRSLTLAPSSGVGDRDRVNVRAYSYAALARIRLFLDGEPVEEQILSGTEFEGQIAVPHRGGSCWLTALAVDTNGLVSAPLGLRLSPVGLPTRSMHAILVGVDNFFETNLKLEYAESDAQRLAAALRANAGNYYHETHVKRLLGVDATPQAIRAALREAVCEAGSGDTIIFSFAGHGVNSNDGYYLTPAGYRSTDVSHTGLSWSEVAKALQSAKARVVVLLDACHSGLAGSEGFASNDDVASALLQGARAPILVLAASKGRQWSLESVRWGGGVFTHALIEVIHNNRHRYTNHGNGALDVSELFRGVRGIVGDATGRQQQPWLARHDLIGDFALL